VRAEVAIQLDKGDVHPFGPSCLAVWRRRGQCLLNSVHRLE
jgi:hypothetical protein